MMPTVSVIIPTYKEAENLPLLIPQIASVLGARGWTWEVIVVDDNSPDLTRHVLDELSMRFPQVRFLIRLQDRGLSSAVLAGLELAHHDYVVVMDADLSHPAEAIPDMIEKLTQGTSDFVIGSRYVEGGKTEDWSRLRWLNSAGATLLAKPLVGSVKDPMAGFFAMRRESLRQTAALNPIGYKIGLELIVKTGLSADRVAEVPITFKNRIHGESKLTMKEQFKYLEHLSRLYDFKFPKASPRAKFLIAAGCGGAACYAALAAFLAIPVLHMAGWVQVIWPLLAIAAGLAAMILVTLAFFVRYVRTQRAFLMMKNPYTEFTCISAAELIAGWGFAVSTLANIYLQMTVGLVIVMMVRYTLRKVFLHDLRGIRGIPNAQASLRLTLAPKARTSAA
jgi:dolichol-phosphate mannosyltransferase